jgi:hypothetical protein
MPTCFLCLATLSLCLGAAGAADVAPAAAPAPATPHEVQAAIAGALAQDSGLWSDFDLDGDGKVSQVEVIAMLAKQPGWLRRHFPELFQRIDLDHDNAVSYTELSGFAALADVQEFTLAQRARSLTGVAAGGGMPAAGAGVTVTGPDGRVEASASFIHQQAYIAGYQVVAGQYQPIIGVLGYGTVLNVGDVIITIVHHQG